MTSDSSDPTHAIWTAVFGRTTATCAISIAAVFVLACGRSGEKGRLGNQRTDAAGDLVVVTYGGGDYERSHVVAFIRPFGIASGRNVQSVVWGAEYGRLQEMVRSRNVPWDVVEVTAAQYARGIEDSLFETLPTPIDSTVFRPIAGTPGIGRYGAPNVYWSTVLAFRKGQSKNATPASWADFYDMKRFPGPRALYDDPRGNLEFALLAAGVAVDSLYPLNVDLAFRQLDKIRPFVKVWWKDGTEAVRLLVTGQVAMSSAWSGRIFASETAKSELQYVWNGAAHELDYWVIPRGSQRVIAAGDFIHFASTPGPMARQAAITGYGPANVLALDSIAPTMLPMLPTYAANWQKSFVVQAAWWAANEKSITQRWLRWKTGAGH